MIAIINGNIVQEHGILKDHALLIEQERIYDIVPQAKLASMRIDEVYNAYGGYITPGFIDMHSDHIEAMAAPRPAASWIWSWLYMNSKRNAVPMASPPCFTPSVSGRELELPPCDVPSSSGSWRIS